ncbi:MAG: hypothetical protein UU01_C0013G0015 [Parcubacteria group bacterium GW2011_GWA2_40_37]|nr:MAG: hypothetical protein UU01_C0013G0015 [Parcubacteria group bacterium GW2011_GWA2_40_37]
MVNKHRINLTLVYFLAFTIVSSVLAFHIIVKAYDSFDNTELTYAVNQ